MGLGSLDEVKGRWRQGWLLNKVEVIRKGVDEEGGHPQYNLANKAASVLASLLHRPPRVGKIPLASYRTWGLFNQPSRSDCLWAHTGTHTHTHAHTHSQSVTHIHTEHH